MWKEIFLSIVKQSVGNLEMYLEGMGIISIERLEGVSTPYHLLDKGNKLIV